MPAISVITICFNNLTDLQKTCISVDAQTERPTEHWIINGSTNNDIAGWLSNTTQPRYRRWINERDNGIADAFNKGIEKSNGNIVHLLNSGDVYAATDVLEKVQNVFDENNRVQWVSGKLKTKRSGHWVEVGKPFDKQKLYRGMRSVSHPTWFVKREVYNRVGLYNSIYRIGMDYDMLCRIVGEPYQFINKTLVTFDDAGISSVGYLNSLKENIAVYESHFGFSITCRLWQLRLRILYLLLQTGFGKFLFRMKKNMGLENV